MRTKNGKRDQKSIWFHAWKVDHETYFSTTTYREQKKDKHLMFIYSEKAYDKIPHNVMWRALDKHKMPTRYITLIKNMYSDIVTTVRTNDDATDDL